MTKDQLDKKIYEAWKRWHCGIDGEPDYVPIVNPLFERGFRDGVEFSTNNVPDHGRAKDELIVKQQIEIESLKKEVSLFNDGINEVYNIIFCIGGPLNDNKLRYTKEQMMDFWKIKEALGL